ncbi:unnamed protein product [Didymodactylos carnosus]|uniref:Uncharacterized protein n=2 Tax=Didymodactylos carnosus TaxID=1234261 RepID=A0A816C439_9BILA|nr:unnamed protein product [Didymodactylos carnosus]CAF4504582.1 unnamed protein product [Didymodactylos carnosus]
MDDEEINLYVSTHYMTNLQEQSSLSFQIKLAESWSTLSQWLNLSRYTSALTLQIIDQDIFQLALRNEDGWNIYQYSPKNGQC